MRNFKTVLVESGQENSEAAKMACSTGLTPETINEKEVISNYRTGKNVLKITEKKGEVLDTCATMNKKYACCNVHVLKSVSNCPFDCSYCFLQNYLTDGTTKVVGDISSMMKEVTDKIERQPGRFFRVGTWELGDSLALESVTGQASALIKEFSNLDMAVLELKTKSDCVDNILNIDHKGKTVVSWSMNPQSVISSQEHRTASLDARLKALEKVVKAGYLVGFHFDPMILFDHWETEYPDLVRQIFDIAPANQTAWVSFGSLRFNPEMKKKMLENFPKAGLHLNEMVIGDDGKSRYVRPLRIEMYKVMKKALDMYASDDILTYLCMERWDMWEKIMGYTPQSIGHLDYIFAESLNRRFPGIMKTSPDLSLYEALQDQ